MGQARKRPKQSYGEMGLVRMWILCSCPFTKLGKRIDIHHV